MEEGGISSVLVEILGLTLAGKNVSRPTTGLKKEHKHSDVLVGNRLLFSHMFMNEPDTGTSRHVCENVRTNVRRLDCVGEISSQFKAQSWSNNETT